MKYTPLLSLFLWLSTLAMTMAQIPSTIPPIEVLYQSVDVFYRSQAETQIAEISQTKKFRYLSYLPIPGYSPFTGGFTVQLNLAGPLQEVRLHHTERVRKEYLTRINEDQAKDLKNSIYADYQKVLHAIEEYEAQRMIDSLSVLQFQLATRKYHKNELTPSEFLNQSKAYQNYLLIRQKEANAISESVNLLLYKSKMDAATNNVHSAILKQF